MAESSQAIIFHSHILLSEKRIIKFSLVRGRRRKRIEGVKKKKAEQDAGDAI